MIDNQEYWWITKEENERLNAKGFKSKRPDSDEALPSLRHYKKRLVHHNGMD
jgi:hypothetical protein